MKETLKDGLVSLLKKYPLHKHIDCIPSTTGDNGWEKLDLSVCEIVSINDDVENTIFCIRTVSRKQFPKQLDIQFCASTKTYYILSFVDSDYDVPEPTDYIDMEMIIWSRESDVEYNEN